MPKAGPLKKRHEYDLPQFSVGLFAMAPPPLVYGSPGNYSSADNAYADSYMTHHYA